MNRRGHRIVDLPRAEDRSDLPRYMIPASTSTSMPEVPTLPLALPVPPMVLSSRLTAPDPLPAPPTLSSVVWLLLVPVPEAADPISEDPVLEVPVSLPAPGPVPVSAAVPVPAGVPAAGSAAAPVALVVAAGVETVIAGFTDAEAADVLLSIWALEAAPRSRLRSPMCPARCCSPWRHHWRRHWCWSSAGRVDGAVRAGIDMRGGRRRTVAGRSCRQVDTRR